MRQSVRWHPTLENVVEEMERPDHDDRLYRVITLRNGLEILLIHDAGSDRAGAAMDVRVGSFSDLDDTPGVAHAVERLLPMGTGKYPAENEYGTFLAQHGGYSNSFTNTTSTNYHFELSYPVSPRVSRETAMDNGQCSALQDAKDLRPFRGALDRFAQCFISPLFPQEMVQRELKAIDAEFKRNLQDDNWRLHQVKKALANPKHPYSRLAVGNWKTLHEDPISRGLGPRNKVMEFYSTKYSADRMKLVVLGRESLNTLEAWTDAIFSAIPYRRLRPQRWDVPLYAEHQLMTQTFVEPILQARSLELQFIHGDEEQFVETHPSWYLTYLLGHKGPGSAFALLRKSGWVDELTAESYSPCSGSSLFTITVDLTSNGLRHYKETIKIIFQYIGMMREQPPQECIVDDMMRIGQAQFRFQKKCSPISTARYLASVMQKPYHRTMLLSGPAIIHKFDPRSIRDSIAYLRADNLRVTLICADLPGGWDRKEPWTGAAYKVEKLSRDFLDELEKLLENKKRNAGLHLPCPNAFVPKTLATSKIEVGLHGAAPQLVKDEGGLRIWWKKDDQAWNPKGHIHVYFRTPVTGITARRELATSLFVNLVHDALTVPLYDAIIAGMDYDLSSHNDGLEVTVSGYNVGLHGLLEIVLLQTRNLMPEKGRFHVVRDKMIVALQELDFEEPWEQVSLCSSWFRSAQRFSSKDLSAELDNVSNDEIETLIPQIFAQCQIDVLVQGNFSKEDALKVAPLVKGTIEPGVVPRSWGLISVWRSVCLPPGSNFVYEKELKNTGNTSHCIEYSLYAGSCYDSAVRARLLLLDQLMEQSCFHELRTVQQLGYRVASGVVFDDAWAGYCIAVQSERDCRYLEHRIDSFLTLFWDHLRQLGWEQFQFHKSAVTSCLLGDLNNAANEHARFWDHIRDGSYDFGQGKPLRL
jgi:insulysin